MQTSTAPRTEPHPELASTPDARAELVRRHSPMVARMVRTFRDKVPASVDRNSLFSAGIVGLLDAADKYDGERSVAFEAYARIRVRGAILDELRGLDHLTRTQRRRSRAVADSRRMLERDGPVSDAEVAEHLGYSVEEVQRSRQRHVPPEPLDPGSFELRQLSRLWGDYESSLERLERKEQIKLVSKALAALPERNRLVVGLYYESEITLEEIGGLLGVTQSRVSQILKKTMEMVRERVRAELS